MRRKISLVVAVLLVLVTFVACRDNAEQAETTSSTAESVVDAAALDSTTAESTEVEGTTDPSEESTTVQSVTTTQPSSNSNNKSNTKAQQAASTTTTKANVTTAKSTTPNTPVTTTTQANVDAAYWVNYAIQYGKNHTSLKFHSGVVECWDNPIIISSAVSAVTLERDIQSCLDTYDRQSDIEYFNVWSESLGDGRYRLMVAYA